MSGMRDCHETDSQKMKRSTVRQKNQHLNGKFIFENVLYRTYKTLVTLKIGNRKCYMFSNYLTNKISRDQIDLNDPLLGRTV